MPFFKNKSITFLLLALILQPSITYANEFLFGNFIGKSFKVEKGNRVFTNKNLHSFKSNLTIKKLGKNRIEMKINSSVQMRINIPVRTETRRDKFKIKWKDNNSGSLINESSRYKNDNSKFKIDGNIISIRSWIDRNKMYETQVYELIKP